MSYSLLSTQNALYVLEQFDAGTDLHQILDTLHATGDIGIDLSTINECLRRNGRTLFENQPTTIIHGQSLLSVARASTSQQDPNIARNQITTPRSQAIQAPILRWDAQADTIALSAHHTGQTVAQISAQLCQYGYTTTPVEVTASLSRQGVYDDLWQEPAPFRWDARADAFALAAHNVGQTAPQIAASLCSHGYIAFTIEAVLSLSRQGVQNVRSS